MDHKRRIHIKTALTTLAFLLSLNVLADEVKFAGTPSIAVNKDNTFLNFGGPTVKMENGAYFAGLSFFPSLRKDSVTDTLTPILGAGIYAGKDHLFVIVPSYYYGNNWYSAVGIGYKF